jgi:hypothetical protein
VLFAAWTIIAFLWKLPAWLLLLNLGEIFTVFSYAMLANLLESLIVLLVVLAVSVLLPARLLRDDFAARGSILALGLIGSLLTFVKLEMQFGMESGFALLIGPVLVIVLTVVLLSLSTKSRWVGSIHSAVFWISDRLVVFLFVLVPVFVFLSVYVIFRNIV